ncbi:hypothetical protein NEOLEDRAFT_1242206 [Neolentinus lepideus HHB14362 ss-1]|uniref:Uncharacterized protein n=1 Tax=Neolentinus lepideus HHB14362 ss-1 TaxID=1314782 RepID=A0A165S8Z2_9AGAM|nr:hypothetical protein NEOLEDRAFT_1242206 [Neolentinus lepideus HHB14362 ss-1]
MAQSWQLINIDKRNARKHYSPFPPETGSGDWLLYRLLPAIPSSHLEKVHEQKCAHAKNTVYSQAGLGRLSIPVELLDLIFEAFDDANDMACLSIANTTLWTVGYKHFWKGMKRCATEWEGSRILYVEFFALDTPAGLLTPGELEEASNVGGTGKLEDKSAVCLYRWAQVKFDQQSTRPRPDSLFFKSPDGKFELRQGQVGARGRDGPHPKLPAIRLSWGMYGQNLRDWVLYDLLMKPVYQYDDRWILCNLSKREFVHKPVIRIASDTALHYGDILLYQTYWGPKLDEVVSNDGSHAGGHRGPWAGGRFAIMTLHEFEERLKMLGHWVDMTEVVVKELTELYQAKHGGQTGPEEALQQVN